MEWFDLNILLIWDFVLQNLFQNKIKQIRLYGSHLIFTVLQLLKSLTMAFFASTRSSIKRVVCLSGVIAEKDPIDPGWIEWLLRKLVRSRINDLVAMEDIVVNSGLCYTLVRLPFLTQGTA